MNGSNSLYAVIENTLPLSFNRIALSKEQPLYNTLSKLIHSFIVWQLILICTERIFEMDGKLGVRLLYSVGKVLFKNV